MALPLLAVDQLHAGPLIWRAAAEATLTPTALIAAPLGRMCPTFEMVPHSALQALNPRPAAATLYTAGNSTTNERRHPTAAVV